MSTNRPSDKPVDTPPKDAPVDPQKPQGPPVRPQDGGDVPGPGKKP